MIATTLGELMTLEPHLRRVAELPGLSERAKYDIARLAKAVAVEVKQFHAQRVAMIQEMGQTNGAVTEVPADRMADFQKRIDELSRVEVTIERKPLASTLLTSAKASDLLDLGPLCELVEPGP